MSTTSTSFRGQAITATDVLVGYTYAGDANLSGFIDGDDYFRIDKGFNFGQVGNATGAGVRQRRL